MNPNGLIYWSAALRTLAKLVWYGLIDVGRLSSAASQVSHWSPGFFLAFVARGFKIWRNHPGRGCRAWIVLGKIIF
jgi:hypothetical protein